MESVTFRRSGLRLLCFWSYSWTWNHQQDSNPDFYKLLSIGWASTGPLRARNPQGNLTSSILSGVLLGTSKEISNTNHRVAPCCISLSESLCTGSQNKTGTLLLHHSNSLFDFVFPIGMETFVFSTRYHSSLFFFFDSWGYFDSWAKNRQQIVGGATDKIPSPQHGGHSNTRVQMTLPIETLVSMEQSTLLSPRQHRGLATMRLRDERHRSLQYLQRSQENALVLDPGACCAGEPVNEKCASCSRAVRLMWDTNCSSDQTKVWNTPTKNVGVSLLFNSQNLGINVDFGMMQALQSNIWHPYLVNKPFRSPNKTLYAQSNSHHSHRTSILGTSCLFGCAFSAQWRRGLLLDLEWRMGFGLLASSHDCLPLESPHPYFPNRIEHTITGIILHIFFLFVGSPDQKTQSDHTPSCWHCLTGSNGYGGNSTIFYSFFTLALWAWIP